jgi:hypothetical protein
VIVGFQSYEQYRTPRAYEWMMRIGDPRTPPILFVPPLFEELNRTRALVASIMRSLAAEGHGCWLPDLGGTSESLTPLESVSWDDWRADVAAAAQHVAAASGKAPLIASIRGGCLIDDGAAADRHWRFAPAAGASLARDMDRASVAGGAAWAGYPASPDLREALAAATAAEVTPLRTLRLSTDPGEADRKVEGPALWRRSEPGNSPQLVELLAMDIAEWRRTCAAS